MRFFTGDYYDRGLLDLDADVYEIDTILLSDMIPKIAPLTLSLGDFSPQSVEAVTRNAAVYAVPHWMCGNFVFYRKGDVAIHDAKTWQALVGELRKRNRGLFVDFFGKSTLGEWYLTMLADRLGAAGAQAEVMKSDKPGAPAAYQAILRPVDGEAPRYLLPARTGLALDKAPLYPEFFAAHTGRKTGTEKGLNAQLRALGKKLNCALPIDRTDTDTMDKCKVP
jgi:ABC-type glycerol-3-phosphate transport system substrate-binding protein